MTVRELLSIVSIDVMNGNYGRVSVKLTRHPFDGLGVTAHQEIKAPKKSKGEIQQHEKSYTHDGYAQNIVEECGDYQIYSATIGTSKYDPNTIVLYIVCVLTDEEFADYDAKARAMFARAKR